MSDPAKYATIFARLAEQLNDECVRVRDTGKGGRQQYVKVQTVMNVLDDVLGPANWWPEYKILDDLTVECSLTIRLPDGTTVTKRDVGIRKPTEGGRLDPGCSWKAGYSDALKRAASMFGVARHLAKCGWPLYVGPELDRYYAAAATPAEAAGPPEASDVPKPTVAPNGHVVAPNGHVVAPNGHVKERTTWRTALPPQTGPGSRPAGGKVPTTGRALFGWVKEQEEAHEVGLVKYLTGWGKLQEFPGRMIDWDRSQVEVGHAEALRKLGSLKGDAYEEAME